MTKKEERIKEQEQTNIVETFDEEGNKVTLAVVDVIDFEEKKYVVLTSEESFEKLENDEEVDQEEFILMELIENGEEFTFVTIDDDEEFERLTKHIEEIREAEEAEEEGTAECNCDGECTCGSSEK